MSAGTQPFQAEAGESTKGALARERMLHAALDVFGRHGFDGATTRMLANRASMNLGAIPYYFGSKEDLYAQAADYLGRCMAKQLSPLLLKLSRSTAGEMNRESLCDCVITFLIAQAKMFLHQDLPQTWMQFFLRVQGDRGPALAHLHRHVITPTEMALSPLIGRIIGCSSDATTTKTLTFLALHQTLHVQLTAASLVANTTWQAMTQAQTASLLDTIGLALRSQLMNFRAAPTSHP